VNTCDKVAEVKACVLTMLMVSSEVPLAKMVEGAKDFETVGKDGVTASTSLAEHTPATQKVEVLLLPTVAGAVIEAVLVIWVCACAAPIVNRPSAQANESATSARTRTEFRSQICALEGTLCKLNR
jgi:hypothetical protein